MTTLLPPAIPNDDLIAKCSPRGAGNGGNVVWQGFYAKHSPPADPARYTPKPDTVKRPAMTYIMEHWASRKNFHRVVEGICITNLYCGVGKGWDIVVHGTIIHHEASKADAQREAEKLLEGKC
jgi:hypothetical protein